MEASDLTIQLTLLWWFPGLCRATGPSSLATCQRLTDCADRFPVLSVLRERTSPLIPVTTLWTLIAVASTLGADCQHEAAFGWFEVAFDPLARSNTWPQCED